MNIWTNIHGRLKKLEQFKSRVQPGPKKDFDIDGFLFALVGHKKDSYLVDGGGFDVMQALNDTAAADWKDEV